jgi:hypothetical protein
MLTTQSLRDGGGTRSGSPVSSPLKSPEAGRTFSGSTTVGLPPPDRGQSPGGSKVRDEEEMQLGLLPPSIDVWLKGLRNTPAWRAAVGGYIARFKDEDIDMDVSPSSSHPTRTCTCSHTWRPMETRSLGGMVVTYTIGCLHTPHRTAPHHTACQCAGRWQQVLRHHRCDTQG